MTKTRTVRFPAASISSVIGERGVTIRSIKRETNTKIHIEDEGNGYALANICGFTEEQCNEAEQKILQIVSVMKLLIFNLSSVVISFVYNCSFSVATLLKTYY